MPLADEEVPPRLDSQLIWRRFNMQLRSPTYFSEFEILNVLFEVLGNCIQDVVLICLPFSLD